MQLLLDLIICTFAVARVSYMIAYEDGPFDIFSKWREHIGQQNWIGRGFHCALCISWWLSAIASLYVAQTVVQFFLYWLAIAGAALLLHKVIKKL